MDGRRATRAGWNHANQLILVVHLQLFLPLVRAVAVRSFVPVVVPAGTWRRWRIAIVVVGQRRWGVQPS